MENNIFLFFILKFNLSYVLCIVIFFSISQLSTSLKMEIFKYK